MLKVVPDTNVLVSALISPNGAAPRLLNGWRERKYELVLSPAILEELAEVLQRDRIRHYYEHVDKELAQKYVAGIRRFATLVPGKVEVSGVYVDPDDDKFIAAALEAEADLIISRNEHLLRIREYQGVRILRPSEFVAML
ncbi:MAG TPA: putative toxin-antitoxin system toxin component, PIN family [Firmicutes bacterium]|nr:putative toxin-antitoxin system toxin component, PIN family [Candidatus Fermentithermobacillaceae bacterium]